MTLTPSRSCTPISWCQFPKEFRAHDGGTDGVCSIHDEIEVVASPDENIITVDAERLHYADVLYQPSSTGKDASRLNERHFFLKCDVYNRKEIYANVVLSAARLCPRDLWSHDEGSDNCKDRTPCRARRWQDQFPNDR